MGDFCGFVARTNVDANAVAEAISERGGRDLKAYPELNLVLGIIKSYAPGDGAIKLSTLDGVESFEVIDA